MKPQFTTPCFVRVEDSEKRKEVCEKLIKMGYRYIWDSNQQFKTTIYCDIEDVVVRLLRNADGLGIDCSDNIELFLDLAAMWLDTDKEQWFICYKALSECQYMVGEMTKCYDDEQPQFINPGQYLRRATATEIIEWHKQKGESKQ